MAVSKLELKDLKFVRQELHGVKEKWLDIGMELGASPTDLRKLAETHKQDYSICLNLMLMQWLESGDATWKILCEALKSSMVDEPSLSTQLQERYCSEKSTSKSVKRAHHDDGTAPKAKRPKASPLPTSFPPEDFLRPQPPNRICYKCNKIPRTPLRPECCDTKLYCEPCSLKVKICSTHQTENKFKRDDEHYTAVPKLKIKCPNWKEGCDFKETARKVYGDHLPHCTKAKPGVEHTDTPKATDDPVSDDKGGTTEKTEKPGSKSANGRKSSSEGVVEDEVWYVANEEPQSHKTTTVAAAAVSSTVSPSNGTIRTLLSPKDTVSLSLPTKTPKPVAPAVAPAVAIGGQPLPSTSQQQAPKLQSVNVVQNSIKQSQKPPGDPAALQQQQQQVQSPTERVGTQVAYDVKQLMSMIQQLPANQMVYCLLKPSGCTWKGVSTLLIQHLAVCQYNQKSIQTKVKTEIKQEPQVQQAPPVQTPPVQLPPVQVQPVQIPPVPATSPVLPAVRQPVMIQQVQSIKQEPMSSPQIFLGSQIGHQGVHIKTEPPSPRIALGSDKNQNTQPCQYKAIGCKEKVTKGKMKEHLQESIQHHLDLAIKRILQNEAKK